MACFKGNPPLMAPIPDEYGAAFIRTAKDQAWPPIVLPKCLKCLENLNNSLGFVQSSQDQKRHHGWIGLNRKGQRDGVGRFPLRQAMGKDVNSLWWNPTAQQLLPFSPAEREIRTALGKPAGAQPGIQASMKNPLDTAVRGRIQRPVGRHTNHRPPPREFPCGAPVSGNVDFVKMSGIDNHGKARENLRGGQPRREEFPPFRQYGKAVPDVKNRRPPQDSQCGETALFDPLQGDFRMRIFRGQSGVTGEHCNRVAESDLRADQRQDRLGHSPVAACGWKIGDHVQDIHGRLRFIPRSLLIHPAQYAAKNTTLRNKNTGPAASRAQSR